MSSLPRVTVVCGPTASGKSVLADEISGRLDATCVVVDSMQVYREIPRISNQARSRPASLTGVVSVTEEWSVARHRAAVDAILHTHNTPASRGGHVVLDAGTGMYLNAILMDIELAPRVEGRVRAEAVREACAAGETRGNLRRRARARELELAGAAERGSIWTHRTRLDAEVLYLRPPREETDAAIEDRSRKIAASGVPEARHLLELARTPNPPTPQVLGSIGGRELMEYARTESPSDAAAQRALLEAHRAISTRTRQLARRQVRWFDKMVRALADGDTRITVAEGPRDPAARRFAERAVRARLG